METTVNQDNEKRRTKAIIIGLDGSTWNNLGPWIEKGELPLFREFMEKGVKATLETTIPSSTIPALPTLYTGVNPGEHGILKFTKANGDVVNMSDVAYPKIWNILDLHGLRSLIFNVRFTYPPEPLNGIFLSGNPHPPDVKNLTYPSEMLTKYRGFYNREIYDRMRSYYEDVPRNREEILKVNIEISKMKFGIFKELTAKENFDFIFYWNGRSDGTMHMLWDYPELILELYKHMEDILAEFRSRFPEANLLTLSDHGFHKVPKLRFHVNNYLQQEGFLVRKGGLLQQKLTDVVSGLGRNYVPSWLVERVLGTHRKKAPQKNAAAETGGDQQKEGGQVKLYTKSLTGIPGIDYQRSKAVMRELWGVDVLNWRSEEEYEERAAGVISSLYKARHLGEPVVDFAVKKQDFYSGKYIMDIPDIIFQTKENFIAEYELSSQIVSKPRGKSKLRKYGEHKNARKGIFIATGPDIRRRKEHGEMSILDIVPTVLQLFNLPVPDYLDGKVLTDIFLEPVVVKRRQETPEHFLPGHERTELSGEEKEDMKERLRSLGYFDEV